MLKNKNMHNPSSKKLLHFPNVNFLMKISLGLIFFTLLSTVLVYAETITADNPTIQIVENAYLQNNSQYLDNTLFSSYAGTSVEIINNDVISHKFVSGASNTNNAGQINYDNFLICELGEKIAPDSQRYTDDNICDFNKDNRIITDIISPDESISILLTDVGTYRIIDPDYPWIEFVIYSFPESDESNNINSGFLTNDTIPEQTPVSEPEPMLTPSIETLSVTVDEMPFDVEYTVVGLTVTKIESDTESMSLIFSVDVTDLNGILDVTFERSFFDSIYDDVDDAFFILADGDEVVSEESKNNINRNLRIEVPLGTEELEIIGSIFNDDELESVIETPVIETPVIEDNQCGPGTILENNICVLDQRCGPGTILEDGACVLDSVSTYSTSQSPGMTKELIIGTTSAFVIAGIISIILALISRANRTKN